MPPIACSQYTWLLTDNFTQLNTAYPRNKRVPQTNANFAILETPNSNPVLTFPVDSKYWKVYGVRLDSAYAGSGHQSLVVAPAVGQYPATLGDIPDHLILDHVSFYDNSIDAANAMNLNASNVALVDSRGFSNGTPEIQAFGGGCGGGIGPYEIRNNEFAGAGGEVMFMGGGCEMGFKNTIPSDIHVKWNYVHNPLAWNPRCTGGSNPCGTTTYDGSSHNTVKNIYETKNSARTLIHENYFENMWVAGQDGTCILFEPANQSGFTIWTQIRDIYFTRNRTDNCAQWLSFVGTSYAYASKATKHIKISNNLVGPNIGNQAEFGHPTPAFHNSFGGGGNVGLGTARHETNGISPSDVESSHNTQLGTMSSDITYGNYSTLQVDGLKYKDNLFDFGYYGIMFAGVPGDTGAGSTPYYQNMWGAGNPDTTHNGMLSVTPGYASGYFSNHWKQLPGNAAVFVDYVNADFRLQNGTAAVAGGSDGLDLGAINPANIKTVTDKAKVGDFTSGDTTPPTVSMTAPSPGTVSGTITCSASATDNVSVATVQFQYDGYNIGSAQSCTGTSCTASISWDTTQVANGSHTLTAYACDTSSNCTTSAGVAITVNNGAPPPGSIHAGTMMGGRVN